MLKSIKYSLIAIGMVLSLYLSFIEVNAHNNVASIIFFNIGQGDSILIITPENERILIDGGPGNYLISEIGKYLPFYNRYIDLMVLTHAHDDHVSGLNEILRRYDVGMILYPGDIDYMAESYVNWLDIINSKDLELHSAIAGEVYNFKSSTLEILYPFTAYSGEKVADVNDTSVVSRYCYSEICILLTGDATAEVEEQILESNQVIYADILKMAHHGSQYSNTEIWLKAVNPGTVVIQSGEDNTFNHPHLRILKRLGRLGVKVLRNDFLGEIVIQTDGINYWLN